MHTYLARVHDLKCPCCRKHLGEEDRPLARAFAHGLSVIVQTPTLTLFVGHRSQLLARCLTIEFHLSVFTQ